MLKMWRLWLAIVVLSVLLGFIFWAEVGFDSTVIIYDEGEAIGERAEAPQVAAAEEAAPVPEPETPLWFTAVRWGAIVIAAGSLIYIVYLGWTYWRRRGHS
jgi:hypothetical protein